MPTQLKNCYFGTEEECMDCEPHYALDHNSLCVKFAGDSEPSVSNHRIRHHESLKSFEDFSFFGRLFHPKLREGLLFEDESISATE